MRKKPTRAVQRKIRAGRGLIESCISPKGDGIWADSTRYRHQLWTRDFVLAAQPVLHLLGHGLVARRHLMNLRLRQMGKGKVPILFLDDEKAFILDKAERAAREGRVGFMLRRYCEDGSVGDLSPWTRDSEVLYILGLYDYSAAVGDSEIVEKNRDSIRAATTYIQSNLLAEGLLIGADWRDSMTDLGDKALLSNNVLLCRAYELMGNLGRVKELKRDINDLFGNASGYVDHLGTDAADTFGQALGVIYDVIPQKRWPGVLAKFAEMDTPYGYMTNDCRPNPITPDEKRLLKRMKQSSVVWPFIHGYAILALLKMGEQKLAEQAFRKYTNLEGFWEWYDPKTGKGYGSNTQLWSAALYLRVADALGYDIRA